MREQRRSSASAGTGWLAAISLVLALAGALLIAFGVIDAAFAGLSGKHPTGTPFLAAAVCGGAALLLAAVGWLRTTGRTAVRGWLVIAGLISGLVVAVGARGAYENRARPLAACRNWNSPPPATSKGTENVLNGVAATSPSNAWAVGWCGNRTLILHWDGTTWELQPSPNVGWPTNVLRGVAATSPSNAWAVGGYTPEGATYYLAWILHWDGTTWTRQPSPDDAQANGDLNAVAATSPSDAWAVGSDNGGPLILRWDGKAWTRQPGPDMGAGVYPYLTGVAATSASNAWAVGWYGGLGAPFRTVIFHWDGTAWELQSSPNVGTGSGLNGVAATSPSDAWAVGWYADGTERRRTLILHWDGKAWKQEPGPNVGTGESVLNGVAAASPSNAWAAGTRSGRAGSQTLILCWNDTTWKRLPSTNAGIGSNILNGVGAVSSANAWAVGLSGDGTAARVPLTHC